LELEVRLPAGLAGLPARPERLSALAVGEARSYRRPLLCRRWGGRLVGHVRIRVRDRLGFFVFGEAEPHELPLRVDPPPEALRRPVRPMAAHAHPGDAGSPPQGARPPL